MSIDNNILILIVILQYILGGIVLKMNSIKEWDIQEGYFIIWFIPVLGVMAYVSVIGIISALFSMFAIPKFIYAIIKKILFIKEK